MVHTSSSGGTHAGLVAGRALLRSLGQTDLPEVLAVGGTGQIGNIVHLEAKARGLENLKRQWGVHAAGVIMSSEPLIDIVPIMKREQDGAIITQFDYPMCEALGLVKMDFLGLRNLTVMDDCLESIRDNIRTTGFERQGHVHQMPVDRPESRFAKATLPTPTAAM